MILVSLFFFIPIQTHTHTEIILNAEQHVWHLGSVSFGTNKMAPWIVHTPLLRAEKAPTADFVA